MPQIVFIPAILCLFAILFTGTRRAFLNVLLPVLLFLPTNFTFAAPHVKPLTFLDTTFLTLGLGMIAKDLPRWKFTRTDLWVVIWTFSAGYCQYRDWGWSGVGLNWILVTFSGVFPYMAGKLLMESGIRLAAIERFVTFLAAACSIGAIEYFFKANPYNWLFSHFFDGQWGSFVTQIRWGFGRLAGPYVRSELAGILLMIGLVLTLWLRGARYPGIESLPIAPLPRKRVNLILILIVITLFMTQARGPWIGALIAIPVASIGRAKRPRRRAVLIFTLAVLVGVPSYVIGKSYIEGPRTDFGSERETAQYRAELIDNYIPVAEVGGAWGWGYPFPTQHGQDSIDNEFLLAWLMQGAVGLCALLLLFIETIAALVRIAIETRSMNDRSLAYALLGITLGLAFVLSTVFLGAQCYQVFFLLVGWSQAIEISGSPDTESTKAALAPVRSQTRVYT